MPGITGIVLAAGEGRRAGGVKAMLVLDGRTFLERVVTASRGAGCDPVIVVGGAEAARVEAEARRLGADFVLNEHWERGQFTSLKAGTAEAMRMAAARARIAGTAGAPVGSAGGGVSRDAAALVALVDHPAVLPATYRALLDAHHGAPGRIVVPVFEDGRTGKVVRGHPVVLPPDVLAEVASAPDGTTLRDIVHEHAGLILEVRVADPGVLKDVDTAADLKDIGGPDK